MSYPMQYNVAEGGYDSVAASPASIRATFVKQTYAHLLGAVLAFVGLEAVLFKTGLAQQWVERLFSAGGALPYLALMVVFMGAGFVAQMMADSSRSKAVQYAGLGLFVAVEAVIFLPLLYMANKFFPGQELPLKAGVLTLLVFGGLTTAVFVSGRDFSFMGPILTVLSLASIGVIVMSLIFGFSLGILFPAAMVVLMAGYIIYDTSNVMHRYHPSQYVAASLALFATLATMFYYVLRLMMMLSSSRD